MTRARAVNSVDNNTLYPADVKSSVVVLCTRRRSPPAERAIDQPKKPFYAVSTPPTTNTKEFLSNSCSCDAVHNRIQGTGVYREIEGHTGAMGDAT